MRRQEVFIDIYEQITGVRFVVIFFLLLIGGSTLYYINNLVKKLEDREKKYVTIYARSIAFFMKDKLENQCNCVDYSFVNEVLEANETIPSIVVIDKMPSAWRNVPDIPDNLSLKKLSPQQRTLLFANMNEMKIEHPPIEMQLQTDWKGYVYYSNSVLIKQLRYFPYVLLGAFLILGSLAFIAYSSSRKAEQNRVWVGLAKETAHQLGTPISALMGWVELFKVDPTFDQNIAVEIEKDIHRLETITTRFSSIGSVPQMKEENVSEILQQTLNYLKVRISTKVKVYYNSQSADNQTVSLNRPLFEWVIENLCKNAVDAMSGIGKLYVTLSVLDKNRLAIDITDTGKGISKANLRQVFKAGFSTKKRGWGLGLTLAKRIIENYHGGRLFVKETTVGKGTTFRIILRE